jgi:hypothetical protein
VASVVEIRILQMVLQRLTCVGMPYLLGEVLRQQGSVRMVVLVHLSLGSCHGVGGVLGLIQAASGVGIGYHLVKVTSCSLKVVILFLCVV